MEAGIWTAGQSQALIHDITTCAEVVQRIVSEAERVLRRLNSGLVPTLPSR